MSGKHFEEAVTSADLTRFMVAFASVLTSKLALNGAISRENVDDLLRAMAQLGEETEPEGLRHLIRDFEYTTARMLDLPPARGRRLRAAGKPPPSA